MRFQARCCQNPACGLRFPVDATSPLGDSCPFCKTSTEPIDEAYGTDGAHATQASERPSGPRLSALLDNVRSLNNVGAIFRTADGVGLHHLYLAGFTPTPNHPKLAKTALGAESAIKWSTHGDALALARDLVAQGHRLWALEGGPLSTPFFDRVGELSAARSEPVVLVVGHEVSGVDPQILGLCQAIVRLPMHGHKGSLNVAVAFGVAAYCISYAGHLKSAPPDHVLGLEG